MNSITIPVYTAAGLVGLELARRRASQRLRQAHAVCWWTSSGFGLPSCQLRAGFEGRAAADCCMQPLAPSTPAQS